MAKYKMLVCNGPDTNEVEADSFRVQMENGEWLELHPRRSDGEVTLSARSKLIIRPEAANCARVDSVAR